MKRILIMLLIAFAFSVSLTSAQQPTGTATPQASRPVYYDTFNKKWLDPTRWLVGWGPGCGPSLECVREIQSDKLRLALRSFGATDSDSGGPWSVSDLYFINPNAINSITADVTQRSFSGMACATNYDMTTHTIVKIGGTYFNTGSGEYADDVSNEFVIWVDTSAPNSMGVGNWMSGSGLGVGTDMGSYPIGTPLTLTVAWDKPNHRFISVVKIKGDPGPGTRVEVPYDVSDTNPPAWPAKGFAAIAGPANCTSAQTFAQIEAFFDNVMINVPLPPAQ